MTSSNRDKSAMLDNLFARLLTKSQQLRNGKIVKKVLESASKLARAQGEKEIKPIHLLWASLDNLPEIDTDSDLNPKLLLRIDTSYADIRNQRGRVQIPDSEPLSEPLYYNDTFLALDRATYLAIVSEEDAIKAETILLAVLTLTDQEVLAAVKRMRISRNTAFESWNFGEIHTDEISYYNQGIAAYRALSQAGIKDFDVESLALRARYDFSFSMAIQATLFHGANIGRKVTNKCAPNSYLALLLGEGFSTARISLVEFGSLEVDELHTKLNSRTIDQTVIPAIKALIKSPASRN